MNDKKKRVATIYNAKNKVVDRIVFDDRQSNDLAHHLLLMGESVAIIPVPALIVFSDYVEPTTKKDLEKSYALQDVWVKTIENAHEDLFAKRKHREELRSHAIDFAKSLYKADSRDFDLAYEAFIGHVVAEPPPGSAAEKPF